LLERDSLSIWLALIESVVQIPLYWIGAAIVTLAGAVGTLFWLYVRTQNALLEERKARMNDIKECERILAEFRNSVRG